jgi:hypothetical protein
MMLYVPAGTEEVDRVPTPPLRVAVPSTVEPLRNCTVPVGVLVMRCPATVAVKRMLGPATALGFDEVSVIVVVPLFTVRGANPDSTTPQVSPYT